MKFIFINNDNEVSTSKESQYVEQTLQDVLKVSDYTLKQVPNFGDLSTEEKYKILFEESGAICTYSSYCPSDVGNSAAQLMNLLAAAGRNQIQDRIYIDTLGLLNKTLNNLLKDTKSPLDCLIGIAQNLVLTIHEGTLYRIVVAADMTFMGYVKRVPFTFLKHE